ncbi:hypothetical protein NG798_26630 [Ancylothrix sp. C2]|uniref:hypothetical protein n=1 Tax=Ancylothrix sp. D3o TaxID=2953691 RepID=UPI0021BA6B9F|nr:hypothetical protein [Ancylothrix sp. D3o]MCT7953380.1 hypothetical protein [Ancylothrix sp. D3o]
MNQTIAFPKGTPQTLITEALKSLPLCHRLLSTNQPALELDVIDPLLDLKEKLGDKGFSKLVKSQYPLAVKEINQKLGMAELKRNLDGTGLLNPTILEALLQIGTEACAALAKGSEELAVTLINSISEVAGVTISTLKTLVRRERKGFNPLPTPKEIAIFQPTVLVTVTKNGKHKNWVAEVMEEPDALGRVQVRMLKTNRKSTLFWWEIEPHQLITPDVEDEIPITELEAIIKEFVVEGADDKYYPLPMYDVLRVKNRVQTLAKLDGEDNSLLKIKWKHLLQTTEQYHCIPSVSILQATNAVPPASPKLEPSQQLTGTHSGFPEENLKLIRSLKNYWQQITAMNQEIERSILSDTRAHLMQIRHNSQCRFEKTLNALFSSVLLLPDEPASKGSALEYVEPVDAEVLVIETEPVDETEPLEYLEPVDAGGLVIETEPVELWKQLEGPLYQFQRMVGYPPGEVGLEIIKDCKVYIKPDPPANKWYTFIAPNGEHLHYPIIDGEWVKEQSEVEETIGF